MILAIPQPIPREEQAMPPSTRWIACALACALLSCPVAGAATPELLATKAGSAACQLPSKKPLGPSYHEIAAKYRADSNVTGAGNPAVKVR
jgi:cytochrome c551/c552